MFNDLLKNLKRLLSGSPGRAKEPVPAPPHKILIGTHHKTGTIWLKKIFEEICREFGWNFVAGSERNIPESFDVWLQFHSRFDFSAMPFPFRGVHLIRDPRDKIVSGCFYHQTSGERWLHEPKPEFDGLSYQEAINQLETIEEKIAFEMEKGAWYGIRQMTDWDYDRRDFFELKYEDLIQDRNLSRFENAFRFLGFPDAAIPRALEIANGHSLFSGLVKPSGHIRSGKANQWRDYFSPAHRQRFIELYADALVRLGYEPNNDWVDQDTPRSP